jgi:hypothetical protein
MGNWNNGAGNGIRTRDPQLGRLMLYQLSYSRNPKNKIYKLWIILRKKGLGGDGFEPT